MFGIEVFPTTKPTIKICCPETSKLNANDSTACVTWPRAPDNVVI